MVTSIFIFHKENKPYFGDKKTGLSFFDDFYFTQVFLNICNKYKSDTKMTKYGFVLRDILFGFINNGFNFSSIMKVKYCDRNVALQILETWPHRFEGRALC